MSLVREQVTAVLIALVEAEVIVIFKSSSYATTFPGATSFPACSANSTEAGFFHSAERGLASEPLASFGLIAKTKNSESASVTSRASDVFL